MCCAIKNLLSQQYCEISTGYPFGNGYSSNSPSSFLNVSIAWRRSTWLNVFQCNGSYCIAVIIWSHYTGFRHCQSTS